MKRLLFIFSLFMSIAFATTAQEQTYTISPADGNYEGTNSRHGIWTSTAEHQLSMTATYEGNVVDVISTTNSLFKLCSAVHNGTSYDSPITYTLSVPNGYFITGYSITFQSPNNSNYNMTITDAKDQYQFTGKKQDILLSAEGLSETKNVYFTIEGATLNHAVTITNFTVTIASEGGEEGGEVVEPATGLVNGAYYRLKTKNATGNDMYMNVSNNDKHESGSVGGVNVTTLDENSNNQIFVLEESGNVYKLKASSGHYIYCQPWNVDAYSTTSGTELTFVSAGNDAYYIKWDNKERDDYFKVENNNVYCDAALAAAATWVFEKTEPIVSYTVTTVASPEEAGTARVSEGTSSEKTSLSVKSGTEVTLHAAANVGYAFVNWTLNGEEVSTTATHNVTISDNSEFVANFKEVKDENARYCRIAYDIAPAVHPISAVDYSVNAAAMVENNYTISPSTGDITSGTKNNVWNYIVDNNLGLNIVATDASSNKVNAISVTSGTPTLRFYAANVIEGTETISTAPTTYTLSVAEGCKITGYSMTYKASTANKVMISSDGYSNTPADRTNLYTMAKTGLNVQSITFNISTPSPTSQSSYYITVSDFTVTIASEGGEDSGEEGGEVVEPATIRYYVQGGTVGANNHMVLSEEKSVSSIFYYSHNKLLSYNTGTYVREEGDNRGLQHVGSENAGRVDISTTDGMSLIKAPSYMHLSQNGTDGTYYIDHCSNDGCGAAHYFVIEEVDSLPVTISSAGYATFYAPVAVTVPSGVTAHTVTINGEWATLNEIKGGVIPANTGVVLQGEANTYNFAITDDVEAIESDLLGTVAATYITEDAYVLSNGANGIGFYGAIMNQLSNTAFLNNSHKAYLPMTNGMNAASYSFRFPDTTAIEEVETENAEVVIYDLAGRRMKEITKAGVYVVNGKKILVK